MYYFPSADRVPVRGAGLHRTVGHSNIVTEDRPSNPPDSIASGPRCWKPNGLAAGWPLRRHHQHRRRRSRTMHCSNAAPLPHL